MTPRRALGIAIAVAGAVFLFLGLNASGAPLEQASEALTGSYSNHTLWYIVGGLGAMIAGVSLALPTRR
jgi:di/tricarboxylate transporter